MPEAFDAALFAVQVNLGRIAFQERDQRVGRDGNRILPVASKQERRDDLLALRLELVNFVMRAEWKAAGAVPNHFHDFVPPFAPPLVLSPRRKAR